MKVKVSILHYCDAFCCETNIELSNSLFSNIGLDIRVQKISCKEFIAL